MHGASILTSAPSQRSLWSTLVRSSPFCDSLSSKSRMAVSTEEIIMLTTSCSLMLLPNSGRSRTRSDFLDTTLEVLSTRRDADRQPEEYKKAYKAIWRVLTRASMQKIAHGKHLTKTPALCMLWDMPENKEKDIEPGTFAELLRFGSVHFEQDRKNIDIVKAEKPEHIIREPLLGP